MHNEEISLNGRQVLVRGVVAVGISLLAAWLTYLSGITPEIKQTIAVGTFLLIICATLFFWNFRLAIAFLGIALLLGARVFTLEEMLVSAQLDIILFLVGMMTLVGVLKDLGLFSWVIQTVINVRRMNGTIFTLILVMMSGVLAGLVDEVTSIVFVLALVFQVCDTLKIRPTPFVMISVLATNIGSSGTMLGNPVGILVGTKAGFSFHDFLVWASPITVLCLVICLGIVMVWYRREIQLLTERLEARRNAHLGLGPLVRIPYRRGLIILVSAILFIAMHHVIEEALGVARNTFLIVAPLTISGVLMIYRRKRARHYIEAEVDWWTLLFFMMLFAVAGALEHTGVTAHLADRFHHFAGGSTRLMIPLVVAISALGSAFVDNIVFVAAFIPVIKSLDTTALWWALLFGACLGGNITAIGSTANIVALGMLEKRYRAHVAFLEWLKIGAIVGGVTCAVAWIGVTLLLPLMPSTSSDTRSSDTRKPHASPVVAAQPHP